VSKVRTDDSCNALGELPYSRGFGKHAKAVRPYRIVRGGRIREDASLDGVDDEK